MDDDDDYRIKQSTTIQLLYEINERLIDLEVSQTTPITSMRLGGGGWIDQESKEEVRERIKNKYSYLEKVSDE